MEILTAIISGLSALLVCLINNHFQMQEADKKHTETISMIEYKLDELTKRVEKHNNVIERTYRLEEAAALMDEKMRVANHRIEDLEKR